MYRQQDPYQYQPHRQPTDFGSLSYGTVLPQKFGLPVEEMAASAQMMYERGEQTRHAYEELALATELEMQHVMPDDRHHIENIMGQIGSDIDRYVEGGNFHNMEASHNLSKWIRKLATDTGRNAALQRKQAIAEWQEGMQERVGVDGDLPSPEYLELAYRRSYNEPIQIDDQGNVTGGFRGYTPPRYINIQEDIQKNFGDWNKFLDENKGVVIDDKGDVHPALWNIAEAMFNTASTPYMTKTSTDISGITQEKAQHTLLNYMMRHQEYMAWIEADYEMRNYDPDKGGIRDINPNEIINTFIDSGTPDTYNDRLDKAIKTYEGGIAAAQRQHWEANNRDPEFEELSDSEAIQRMHRQLSLEDRMLGDASALGNKFAHRKFEIKQDIRTNFLYEHLLKGDNDSRIYLANAFSDDGDIDYGSIHAKTRENADRADRLNLQIERLNKNIETASDEERSSLIDQRRILQQDLNMIESENSIMELGIKNILGAIGTDNLDAILSPAAISGSRVHSLNKVLMKIKAENQEEIKEIVKTGNLAKLEDYLYDYYLEQEETIAEPLGKWDAPIMEALTFGLIGPNSLIPAFRMSKESWVDRRMKQAEENAKKLASRNVGRIMEGIVESARKHHVDPETLQYHNNLHYLIPGDNTELHNLTTNVQSLAEQGNLSFTTDQGQSSVDKDIQDIINSPNVENIIVSPMGHAQAGSLMFSVNYRMKNGDNHRYVINSPITVDPIAVAKEVYYSSHNSGNYSTTNYELRSIAKHMFANNTMVENLGVTLGEAIRNHNMEAWTPKPGEVANSEEMRINVPTGDVTTHLDIQLFKTPQNHYSFRLKDGSGEYKTATEWATSIPELHKTFWTTPEGVTEGIMDIMTKVNPSIWQQ